MTAAAVAHVKAAFADSIAVKQAVIEGHAESVVAIAELATQSLANGGKLLFCGNGGSAADAQHLAAELLVRLRSSVNREGLPAIALALDTSSLTACGNDYSYEVFYERMVRTLGRPGDVLIGITTSGKSPNVLKALAAARDMGIKTVGLLGGTGGPALALCDLAFVVPSPNTARVQESHITAGHTIIELIEDGLLASGHIKLVP